VWCSWWNCVGHRRRRARWNSSCVSVSWGMAHTTKPSSVERCLFEVGGSVHSELICPFLPQRKQIISSLEGVGVKEALDFCRVALVRRPFPLPRPLGLRGGCPLPEDLPLPRFPLPFPLGRRRLPLPLPWGGDPTGTTTGKKPRATRAFANAPRACK